MDDGKFGMVIPLTREILARIRTVGGICAHVFDYIPGVGHVPNVCLAFMSEKARSMMDRSDLSKAVISAIESEKERDDLVAILPVIVTEGAVRGLYDYGHVTLDSNIEEQLGGHISQKAKDHLGSWVRLRTVTIIYGDTVEELERSLTSCTGDADVVHTAGGQVIRKESRKDDNSEHSPGDDTM
jgi:hypothetical protein